MAFLLTAEGAVPPSNIKLESRRTRFAQNEMQEMIDEWWQKNTLLFRLLDDAVDWMTDNLDPERDGFMFTVERPLRRITLTCPRKVEQLAPWAIASDVHPAERSESARPRPMCRLDVWKECRIAP